MATTALPNREGQTVPDVSFKIRRGGDWATVTTDDPLRRQERRRLLAARRLHADLLVDPPAALQRARAGVQGKGIDSIICVAVNDPFVMEEWGKDQEAENVVLLPDGNGAFTEAMGLLVDKSDLNFGKRSWRYSMLVRDKTIEKMFLEPQKPGDPFEVSDADTMLATSIRRRRFPSRSRS